MPHIICTIYWAREKLQSVQWPFRNMWRVYIIWIGSKWGHFEFDIRFSHRMYQIIPTPWHKTAMAWRFHWNVEKNWVAWSSNNTLWAHCNGKEFNQSYARNYFECGGGTNINARSTSAEFLFIDGSRNGPITVEFDWYDLAVQKCHPMSLDLQCAHKYKTWRNCSARFPS